MNITYIFCIKVDPSLGYAGVTKSPHNYSFVLGNRRRYLRDYVDSFSDCTNRSHRYMRTFVG